MIGHFPPPHDDELLYNIIARMFELVGYPDSRGLGQDIFQSSSATAVADLPHRLSMLASMISPEAGLTPEILIEKHTLWPYWSAFHSAERRTETQLQMAKLGHPGHPYLSLGLMATRAPWPRFFRYCTSCVECDRQSPRGETFWHRVHQIPGIEVCGIHREQLQDSNIEFRQPRNRYAYVSAESADLLQVDSRGSEDLIPVNDVEVRLAQNADWILTNPWATRSGLDLRERYLWELALRRYATWSGRLHIPQLRSSFLDRYPADWLTKIGCGFTEVNEGWLERLFRKPLAPQSTLRHLLLIDFLELSVETVLSTEHSLPFGPAPWPCLNRACSQFGEPIVLKCEISRTRNGGSLSGQFSCPACGMSYIRLGPDRSTEDRNHRDWIPVYGPVWDELLTQLWDSPSISLRSLSRRLGVDTYTAQLQAARLHLNALRPGLQAAAEISSGDHVATGAIRSASVYQAEWLSLRERNPEASRTELRNLEPKLYSYLLRHARPWLEENFPSARKPRNVQRMVDWPARDLRISQQVAEGRDRLLHRMPPVRLTRTALLREAGYIWALQKLGRLPSTDSVLSSSTETRVAFAVRRIEAVASECNREQNQPVPRWSLIRRANLRPELLLLNDVGSALDRALAHVNTDLPVLDPPTKSKATRAGS
jgi:hypothetical protein